MDEIKVDLEFPMYEPLRQHRWTINAMDSKGETIPFSFLFNKFKLSNHNGIFTFDIKLSQAVGMFNQPEFFSTLQVFKVNFLDPAGTIVDSMEFEADYNSLELEGDYASADPLNYKVSYVITKFLSSSNK